MSTLVGIIATYPKGIFFPIAVFHMYAYRERYLNIMYIKTLHFKPGKY